jgi:hypothetical protein
MAEPMAWWWIHRYCCACRLDTADPPPADFTHTKHIQTLWQSSSSFQELWLWLFAANARTHTHTQTRWSQSRTRSPSSDRPLPPRSYLTITSDRLAERIRIIIIKRSLVNVIIQRNYLKPTHTHAVASTEEGGGMNNRREFNWGTRSSCSLYDGDQQTGTEWASPQARYSPAHTHTHSTGQPPGCGVPPTPPWPKKRKKN